MGAGGQLCRSQGKKGRWHGVKHGEGEGGWASEELWAVQMDEKLGHGGGEQGSPRGGSGASS